MILRRARSRLPHRRARLLALAAAVALVVPMGCQTQSVRLEPESVYAIRAGRYGPAREELRRWASNTQSPDVVLDNLRLAVAALHDGALFETRDALRRMYPFLVAGTINPESRQTAAELGPESQRIWKGEPFEIAMAWYYQALMQMIDGDWENARAATRNMLFTLVDFAGADTVEEAMREAESPEWFDERAEKVESDLVLGYLMAGIAERFQGRRADADAMFDRAASLRPELSELIAILRDGDYNALVFVEAERGPRKVPHGQYGEYFTFEPQPTEPPAPLSVSVDESRVDVPERLDAVDVWALAQHPRWWSLQSLRETKRVVGDVLTLGGVGAAVIGTQVDDDNARDKMIWGGIAAALLGQSLATSSAADLRHADVLPRTVYIVPLRLENRPNTLSFTLSNRRLSATRHYITPGDDGPAVYVTRLAESAMEGNLPTRADAPVLYPNDVTGPIEGTYPYILGGTSVVTPSAEALAAYQAGGHLTGYTLEQLHDLYRAEGIVALPRASGPDVERTYRHILRGGLLQYTPYPGTLGFERLTYTPAPPYEPRSEVVRQARLRIGEKK